MSWQKSIRMVASAHRLMNAIPNCGNKTLLSAEYQAVSAAYSRAISPFWYGRRTLANQI